MIMKRAMALSLSIMILCGCSTLTTSQPIDSEPIKSICDLRSIGLDSVGKVTVFGARYVTEGTHGVSLSSPNCVSFGIVLASEEEVIRDDTYRILKNTASREIIETGVADVGIIARGRVWVDNGVYNISVYRYLEVVQ